MCGLRQGCLDEQATEVLRLEMREGSEESEGEMRKGLKAEQLEKKYWEFHGYSCRIFPKAKWYAQDLFGFDLVCVNDRQWVLVQVKSRKNRLPAFETKVMRQMLETPMPPETARFWVGYNMETGRVKREQVA